MKFKILDKYWQVIQTYLNTHPELSYIHTQNQQTQTVTITILPQSPTININQQIAYKLLSEFNKQKINKPKLILSEWLSQYAKILGSSGIGEREDEEEFGYLNYMMMLEQFQEIKSRILEKRVVLGKLVEENRIAKERYQQECQFQEEKIRLGLTNIEYRMKIIGTKDTSSNEQLTRIKNLLKNGMWGTLPQIQSKLQQIQTLQTQINKLKLNKPN